MNHVERFRATVTEYFGLDPFQRFWFSTLDPHGFFSFGSCRL
jgi:hypothetical protein